jgi:hypothetical protein
MNRYVLPFALAMICLAAACGGDDDAGGGILPVEDVQTGDEVSGDIVEGDVSLSQGCPAGAVTLNFVVDDTANQTYGGAELIWTGSFAFDATTNHIVFATSWLPEEGPYPGLFDDGPRSDGGHEPPGSTAGDHIWGTSVCYVAEQSRTLSYGVLNGDFRWIWTGPNGLLDVAEGAGGSVDVPGMTLGAHGDRDFRLFLDLAALHSDFQGSITTDDYGIFVKGTMNSWTPIQLLDDGENGDAVAGDGILTYEHSRFLGTHDGLLSAGQEAQFVFVYAMDGTPADDGIEYKVAGDAALEGVSATGQCGAAWAPVDVVHALDSKGVVMNASLTLCDEDPPAPGCATDEDCDENQVCVDDVCADDTPPVTDPPEIWLLVPDTGDVSGGDTVSIQGSGFQVGAEVTLGGETASVKSLNEGEIIVETPPHEPGAVDVAVTNPDDSVAEYSAGFTYQENVVVEDVVLTDVTPMVLSPMGGTVVVIQGIGLDATCALSLGGSPLDAVGFQGGALTFQAPSHVPGDALLELACPLGDAEVLLTYAHNFDGNISDWPADTQIATNAISTDWGENDWLQALFAGSDGETLYIGVLGKTLDGGFGKNAIVVYIDTDHGEGTGVSDTSTFTDEDGAVDNALGGVLKFSADGFGAELGFASLDLADYWPGTDDPAVAEAGWRSFENPADLGWLIEGAVVGGEMAMEASIPLSSLYGDATGASHTLAIGVRIVNADGQAASNQALPGLVGDEPPATNATVAVVGVDY